MHMKQNITFFMSSSSVAVTLLGELEFKHQVTTDRGEGGGGGGGGGGHEGIVQRTGSGMEGEV